MKGIPTLYNHPCIVMKLFQVLRQPFKSLISPAGLCKYDTHVTKKIVRRKNTGKKTSYFNCLIYHAFALKCKWKGNQPSSNIPVCLIADFVKQFLIRCTIGFQYKFMDSSCKEILLFK